MLPLGPDCLPGLNAEAFSVAAWGVGTGFGAMVSLSVADNLLSGSLPNTWGQQSGMPALRFFNASHNAFSGTVPGEWGNVPLKLNGLDVGNNTLTGGLRACMATNPPGWIGLVLLDRQGREDGAETRSWCAFRQDMLGSQARQGVQGWQRCWACQWCCIGLLQCGASQLPGTRSTDYGQMERMSCTVLPCLGRCIAARPEILQDAYLVPCERDCSCTHTSCSAAGTLPPSFAYMSLYNLSVAGNLIQGSLPTAWVSLPSLAAGRMLLHKAACPHAQPCANLGKQPPVACDCPSIHTPALLPACNPAAPCCAH